MPRISAESRFFKILNAYSRWKFDKCGAYQKIKIQSAKMPGKSGSKWLFTVENINYVGFKGSVASKEKIAAQECCIKEVCKLCEVKFPHSDKLADKHTTSLLQPGGVHVVYSQLGTIKLSVHIF